jgi:erythrocyte band 7 integral membrane protein
MVSTDNSKHTHAYLPFDVSRGVSIESILIKDIVFSRELQESLSSAATQRRIGESKVIAAKAEVDSARLMRQAADILAR